MVKRSYSRPFYFILSLMVAVAVCVGIWNGRGALDLLQSWDDPQFQQRVHSLLVQTILLVLYSGLVLSRMVSRWRREARYDERRQAAARGQGATLALENELRTSGREPLAIPAKLRLRMTLRSRETGCVFGGVFAILQVVVVISLIPEHDYYSWPSPIIILVADAGFLAFLALLYLVLYIAWSERLRITDEGIRRRRFLGWRTVRWDEARLFALVSGSEYELASRSGIVRWSRPTQTGMVQPTIPFDEYQRQIDGLLLLVRERTGLSLSKVFKERS